MNTTTLERTESAPRLQAFEQVDKANAEIRGAVARGWCSPKNEHKEMDSDLALAIADEVGNLIAGKYDAAIEKLMTERAELIGALREVADYMGLNNLDRAAGRIDQYIRTLEGGTK